MPAVLSRTRLLMPAETTIMGYIGIIGNILGLYWDDREYVGVLCGGCR